MTPTAIRTGSAPSMADRGFRILMGVNAALAVAAAVGAVATAASASDDRIVVEWWRALGLLVFAALWALVAVRPRSAPGAWEVIIAHKAAMAVVGVLTLGAPGAAAAAGLDAYLALSTLAAYLVCRGWTGWHRAPSDAS